MAKNPKSFLKDGPALNPQTLVNEAWGRPDEAADDTTLADLRSRQIKNIPIHDIYPDSLQPRRTVPSIVRQDWNGQPDGVAAVLDRWLHIVKFVEPEEYSRQMIMGTSTREVDSRSDLLPVEVSYLNLIVVAAGIYHDGLINPITVSQDSSIYRLETGERRWLAYHLLHLLFGDEQWAKIPARVVEQPNVWRQALENNARDNLNAIARARQLAILIMDMLGADHFEPFNAFENEREYYAQVADGEQYRIPRGKTERLLQAMGLSNTVQIRQYRALLRLPDDIWQRADDEDWTENKLRRYIPNDDESVTGVTVSPTPPPAYDRLFSHENKPNINAVQKLFLKAGQGDRRAGEKLLSQIEQHRKWLDELERMVRKQK
jgi:hypothetical protein